LRVQAQLPADVHWQVLQPSSAGRLAPTGEQFSPATGNSCSPTFVSSTPHAASVSENAAPSAPKIFKKL
jgi:hypothetical protein